MKLNIEELAKQAGMNVSMWNYGAGSIVFTMGTDGVARGAVERFARLIVERCAAVCETPGIGSRFQGDVYAAAIQKLLEAK